MQWTPLVANPRYYRRLQGRLAQAQRKLSRRALRAKKEQHPLRQAANYQKQRVVVANLQRQVANQRQNFLHLVSTTLIKNHDLVVAEELRSKNLLRNHALALIIADVGWRTFLEPIRLSFMGVNLLPLIPATLPRPVVIVVL